MFKAQRDNGVPVPASAYLAARGDMDLDLISVVKAMMAESAAGSVVHEAAAEAEPAAASAAAASGVSAPASAEEAEALGEAEEAEEEAEAEEAVEESERPAEEAPDGEKTAAELAAELDELGEGTEWD